MKNLTEGENLLSRRGLCLLITLVGTLLLFLISTVAQSDSNQ